LVRPIILPGPLEIINSFIDMLPVLPRAILVSSLQILSGFFLGSSVGIGLGLLMARSWLIYNIFVPLVNTVKPTPIFALIPLFILWFGVGVLPQVMLIAFGCFVIMVVTTAEAIRNVSPIYIQAALSLGADERTIFRKIISPAIVPELIGGVRVASASAFGLDVAAEFMGAQAGIGYLMIVNQRFLRTEGVIVCVIIFTILAVLMDFVIQQLEGKLTSWIEKKVEMASQLRNREIVRASKVGDSIQ
jgi:ABC-type nitrate/sulfonate/bicarbonate transport system permease component